MKINKLKFLVLGAVLLFVTPSCKKYLDQVPDNRAEINTVEKLSQLLATAYPSRDYLTFTEASSDNSEDKGVGIGTTSDVVDLPYAWKDVIGDGTNTPTAYWNACYEAIAAANQALEAIEQNNFGNAALPYKGEALLCRAYAHYMLLNLFSKAYQIGGDNSSFGIPYVTKPETKVIQNYTRGTVASTYDEIKKDFEEGIKLLSSSAYAIPKYHFTPAAGHAFGARLYLSLGEWQKVIDHASLTVSGNDFVSNLRPISTTIKLWTSEEHRTNFMNSSQKYNLLLIGTYSTYARSTSPRHGYGANLVKMFSGVSNITGRNLDNKVLSYGVPNYTSYKFKENFFYTTPSTGFPYLTIAALTVDEALMNRAEAYAEAGQLNLALKDLTDFYSVRITGFNPNNDAITQQKVNAFYPTITDPKQAVIKAILDAKKSQFLQEGIRWFDLMRKNMTVVHNIYDANGNETFAELKPNDPQRLFQLPVEVKLSGVELNPR